MEIWITLWHKSHLASWLRQPILQGDTAQGSGKFADLVHIVNDHINSEANIQVLRVKCPLKTPFPFAKNKEGCDYCGAHDSFVFARPKMYVGSPLSSAQQTVQSWRNTIYYWWTYVFKLDHHNMNNLMVNPPTFSRDAKTWTWEKDEDLRNLRQPSLETCRSLKSPWFSTILGSLKRSFPASSNESRNSLFHWILSKTLPM